MCCAGKDCFPPARVYIIFVYKTKRKMRVSLVFIFIIQKSGYSTVTVTFHLLITKILICFFFNMTD